MNVEIVGEAFDGKMDIKGNRKLTTSISNNAYMITLDTLKYLSEHIFKTFIGSYFITFKQSSFFNNKEFE